MAEYIECLETKVKFPVALAIPNSSFGPKTKNDLYQSYVEKAKKNEHGELVLPKDEISTLLNVNILTQYNVSNSTNYHGYGLRVYGNGSSEIDIVKHIVFFNVDEVKKDLYDAPDPQSYKVLPAYIELTVQQFNKDLVFYNGIKMICDYEKLKANICLAPLEYDESFWQPKNPQFSYQSMRRTTTFPANQATTLNIAPLTSEIAVNIFKKVIFDYLCKVKLWQTIAVKDYQGEIAPDYIRIQNPHTNEDVYLLPPAKKQALSTGIGEARATQVLRYALSLQLKTGTNAITDADKKSAVFCLYVLLFAGKSRELKKALLEDMAKQYNIYKEQPKTAVDAAASAVVDVANKAFSFIASIGKKTNSTPAPAPEKTPTMIRVPDETQIQQILAEFLGIDIHSSQQSAIIETTEQEIFGSKNDGSDVTAILKLALKNLADLPAQTSTLASS